MKIVALIDFLRDHLKVVIWVSCVVLALLVVGDCLFVDKEHAHTKAEHYPGFWAVFGFVACVLIIFVSKWFGHRGIMKREDYYGDE
jgi:hypothetical protein